jgi:hypothetical protein
MTTVIDRLEEDAAPRISLALKLDEFRIARRNLLPEGIKGRFPPPDSNQLPHWQYPFCKQGAIRIMQGRPPLSATGPAAQTLRR